MRALVSCPDPDEAAILTVVLQRAGFEVRSVSDLDKAINIWGDYPVDLFVMSFREDGAYLVTQVERLRSQAVVPIIVIADFLSDDLKVRLLESGTDIVVERPYSARYLIAQVRALMRRAAGMPFFSLPILMQSGVMMDPSTRTIQVNEGEIKRLTQLEFRLLFTLMTYAGRVIPVENLVEYVWGYSGEGNRGLVRGLVQRLRSKVEPNPSEPRYILTESGVGYMFDPHSPQET